MVQLACRESSSYLSPSSCFYSLAGSSVIDNLFRVNLLNDLKNINMHKFNIYVLEFRTQLK